MATTFNFPREEEKAPHVVKERLDKLRAEIAGHEKTIRKLTKSLDDMRDIAWKTSVWLSENPAPGPDASDERREVWAHEEAAKRQKLAWVNARIKELELWTAQTIGSKRQLEQELEESKGELSASIAQVKRKITETMDDLHQAVHGRPQMLQVPEWISEALNRWWILRNDIMFQENKVLEARKVFDDLPTVEIAERAMGKLRGEEDALEESRARFKAVQDRILEWAEKEGLDITVEGPTG